MKKKKRINIKGQEEIIGFGIILIIIAVIALVFISLSINNVQKKEIEDFETSSFLKSLMEMTIDCEKNARFLVIKDAIFECGRNYICENEKPSCDVLNNTLKETMDNNWKTGDNEPIKAYNLLIVYEEKLYFNVSKGIFTQQYKGSMQDYSKLNEKIEIYLKIYY